MELGTIARQRRTRSLRNDRERLQDLIAFAEKEGISSVEGVVALDEDLRNDEALAKLILEEVELRIRAKSVYAFDNLMMERPIAEPSLFRMLALVLPRRLWEEELGDALEVLHSLREGGAPRWQIQLKIFSTSAWCLVNALREVMSAVTGQSREREK